MVKQLDNNKTIIPSRHFNVYYVFKEKQETPQPAMDEASSPMHDEHIKKIREQEKT